MSQSHAYILTAHADPESYTVSAAARIAELVEDSGGRATITNLYDVGFNPNFNPDDLNTYRAFLGGGTIDPPEDIKAEHEKLLASTALVVVFPVYWWAMPAQIKGWFDRVLTSRRGLSGGSPTTNDSVVAHLSAHVLALTGGNEAGYAKRGYDTAMRAQIETGILEYSGFRTTSWTWLWDRHQDQALRLEQACQRVTQNLLVQKHHQPRLMH